MGIAIAQRTEPVEFFLSGGVPEREFNVGVVDVDICCLCLGILGTAADIWGRCVLTVDVVLYTDAVRTRFKRTGERGNLAYEEEETVKEEEIPNTVGSYTCGK